MYHNCIRFLPSDVLPIWDEYFSIGHFLVLLAEFLVAIQYAIHVYFTVGPLLIESSWAKVRVSIGALGVVKDPMVVQEKF